MFTITLLPLHPNRSHPPQAPVIALRGAQYEAHPVLHELYNACFLEVLTLRSNTRAKTSPNKKFDTPTSAM